MSCAEIDELAGAIALDAIPDDEWPAIREHLATCERGHPELRELREVAALLLEAAPPVEPPAGLRGRILAAARSDGQGSSPPTVPLTSPPAAVPIRGEPPGDPESVIRRPERSWWAQPAWAAAAAALILAAGLGAWGISLRRELDRTEERLATTRQRLETEERALAVLAGGGREFRFAADQAGAGGSVLRPTSGPATLVVQGLPPTADMTYQVWAIRGDQPVSLGVFETDASGRKVVTLDHDLHNVDAVAITLEPSPAGSPLPTSRPLMVASVQG